MKQTPVITSKAATDDLFNIKSQFGDIVKGMQDQSLRLQANQQQMKVDQQAKDVQDNAKASEAAKNDLKTKELAIKEAALGM